jgi:hypothetical protein
VVKVLCYKSEIRESSWFYYKEICHDARSHVTMHGHDARSRERKFGIFRYRISKYTELKELIITTGK